MILSDLIGHPVHAENHRVGTVIDVRLVPNAPSPDQPLPSLRVHGLIVSPHSKSSTLGYERNSVRSPWPIAAFVRWRHRESFLVPWADVAGIDDDRITLRTGHRRYAPELIRSAASGPEPGDFENRS